jgi:hypothetical protein
MPVLYHLLLLWMTECVTECSVQAASAVVAVLTGTSTTDTTEPAVPLHPGWATCWVRLSCVCCSRF